MRWNQALSSYSIQFSNLVCIRITDIDECSDASLNNCADSTVAKCWNTHGSFGCQCTTGYYGDGRLCEGKRLYNLLSPKIQYIQSELLELRSTGRAEPTIHKGYMVLKKRVYTKGVKNREGEKM